jgi:hypothetical protein
LITKKVHLKADSEQEAASGRLSCFVDISRSGVQLLKLNDKFKALEFITWVFPHSESDNIWSERLTELLESKEFSSETADNICKFSVSDSKVAIVPETLFNDSEKEINHNFLFDSSQRQEIITQKLSNTDAFGVFDIPKTLANNAEVSSIRSSFLTWTDSLIGGDKETIAYLILDEKQFSLTILKNGKLQFSNWFKHSKPDDVLYFLMATLEAQHILHSDLKLFIGAEIEKGDQTFNHLSKFISKISFLKRPKNLTYSYSFSQLPEHKFPFIFAEACA